MSKESHGPTDRFTGADVGVLLGSGLGEVSVGFTVEASVPFTAIDGLGDTGVAGHRGVVKRACIGDRRCVFVGGRRHIYEEESGARDLPEADRVRALIEFIADAGVHRLIVTSACGSLDPSLPPGRLVLIRDFVDLQMRRPHNGRHEDARRGLPTDAGMGNAIETAAREAGVPLGRGVMACNAGPMYETAAEITLLRRIGVSVVTMSGAPEIAQCRDIGIRVASLALVTNWATGISAGPLAHDEVLAAARGAVGDLRRIFELFLAATTS